MSDPASRDRGVTCARTCSKEFFKTQSNLSQSACSYDVLMAAAAGADDSILSSSAAKSGSTHLAHRLILAAPAMRGALAIGTDLAEETREPYAYPYSYRE